MEQDIFGSVGAALRAARNAGVFGGSNMGVPKPILMPGKMRFPQQMRPDASSIAVTAARYYVTPMWFDGGETFAGAIFRQVGSETGKNVKIAFYGEAASGGPGTLAKSFGAFALGGAAAINQMASTWTPARGLYYGEFVSDSNPTVNGMTTTLDMSDVGHQLAAPWITNLGSFPTVYLAMGVTNEIVGDYVAGTYANFPEATSLTPTTTIIGNASVFPAFGLYA